MGQTINNKIGNTELANAAIHTYDREKLSNNLDSSLSFQEDNSSNYIFDGEPSKRTNISKTMDQFEDYLKEKQAKEKEAGTDSASKEKADKEAAKEIRNNLSSEELKKLQMLGIDVDSARLSDLMGMVNTLRGKEHREATKQMMAEISANNGDMSNLMIAGGGVKVAGTDVKVDAVDVSDIVSTNVNDKASSIEDFTVGKNDLAYLVRNDLEITKENLLKSHFSGMKTGGNVMSEDTFSMMKNQIEDIISQSGIENFDMKDAKFLLDNELPINDETIKKVADFKDIDGKKINDVDIAFDDEENVSDKALKLYEKVNQINPETVEEMSFAGRRITIMSAFSFQTSRAVSSAKSTAQMTGTNSSAQVAGVNSKAQITAKAQMEEIRLMMTISAAKKIVKLDVNIDTKELSEVVDALNKVKQNSFKEAFANTGVEMTDETLSMLEETAEYISDIERSDAGSIATLFKKETFTVRSLHAEIDVSADNEIGETVGRNFDKIAKSYEAVGTAPRRDMGDSLNKAFGNIDELLNELNIEVNDETVRAAKILGKNTLEITQENIDAIVNYDRQINQLIDNFYPEAVMGIIKDGINPIDVPIDELNEILAKKNYNEGVTEATNFATYLRDMESKGEITAEERESYIGIYRVMDKLAKSGDAEAGFIFANRANLTINNMISAIRSRKAKGIDVGIDDNFGMLSEVNTKGKAMDDQINSAFDAFQKLNENVEHFIQENSIEYNMVNAKAVDAIINSDAGIYELVSEVISKLKFKGDYTEDVIDEETDNMSKAMLEDEVEVDPSEALAMDNLLRELEQNGDLSLTYDDIRNSITEMMYNAGAAGVISSLDIAAIKTLNAGLGIMSNMAKQDHYQIPVETENGTTVINLTIKNSARGVNESGNGRPININANVETSEYGRITTDVNIISDGGELTIEGSVTGETSEANAKLSLAEELRVSLEAAVSKHFGEAKISIALGQVSSSKGANVSDNTVSRMDVCRMSVDLVRSISDFVKK